MHRAGDALALRLFSGSFPQPLLIEAAADIVPPPWYGPAPGKKTSAMEHSSLRFGWSSLFIAAPKTDATDGRKGKKNASFGS